MYCVVIMCSCVGIWNMCGTIHCPGFSANQFAGGNVVTFVSTDGRYRMPCDVIPYSSASGTIICDTR